MHAMLPGALVVMGVSGCGKSTLGRALADRLGWQFVEGDTLHPPANIIKMTAGLALDDTDRLPFLTRVAAACAAGRAAGVVVSCSALKRRYRDLIRTQAGNVIFVLPVLERPQLLARLAQRLDHFMPLSLLESQLATMELPDPDEQAVLLDGSAALETQIADTLTALRPPPPHGPTP